MKKRRIVLLTCAFFLVAQLIVMPASHAVDGISPQGTSGDVSVTVVGVAADRIFGVIVCNNGTDQITGFTIAANAVNLDIQEMSILPNGFANARSTDPGTYTSSTGDWVGTLDPVTLDIDDNVVTQCVAIGLTGTVTGALGEEIEITATLESSTLSDSTPNIDPDNSNDIYTYTTIPIVLDPNLVLETRLLTTGAIGDTTPVSYELTISNTGAGDYIVTGDMGFSTYFIIPEGTTFTSVTDPDLTDDVGVSADPDECGSMGSATVLPAFSDYGSELVGCRLTSESGILPAGSSYKLIFNMIASGPFATGDTQALGILVGNDADSIFVQIAIFTPGSGAFSPTNDNVSILDYDNNELTVTINPCSGTSTVVTVNDACFTITFNKQIYEPSFTVADLTLTGQGNIYSFSKTGTNQWTVRINDMKAGDELTLSLINGTVQDYSAVQNTQVLGINTVKYQVTGTASGELAATGTREFEIQSIFALLVLSIGCAMTLLARRRTI